MTAAAGPSSPVRFTGPSILMVGEETIGEKLKDHFAKIRCPIPIVPDPLLAVESHCPRDNRLVLHDGTHLIPNCPPFDGFVSSYAVHALLPKGSDHFIRENRWTIGSGYQEKYRKSSIAFAKAHGIPYKEALSTLEGGNCHLVTTEKGEKKAIIGLNSLLLTMINFANLPHFHGDNYVEFEALKKLIKRPSEPMYRMARNTATFIGCEENLKQNEGIQEYLAKILEPVTEEEREDFFNIALDLEALTLIAINLISKELDIPKKNIAFITQRDFHIDFHTFVIGETLYIHDDRQVVDYLSVRPWNKTLAACLRTAKQKANQFDAYLLKVQGELAEIGIRMVSLPGVFDDGNGMCVNLMNSIVVPTVRGYPHIVASGAQNPIIEEIFQTALAKINPEVEVSFMDSGSTFMQDLFQDATGGLRCFTDLIPLRS